ncbi:ribosomal protein S7 domain-containing protein [Phycomyces blakesleeanus]
MRMDYFLWFRQATIFVTSHPQDSRTSFSLQGPLCYPSPKPNGDVQNSTPTTPHSESAKAAETSEATAAAVESAPEAFNANVISKDPLVSQLVNTLMRDGKKARAQRVILDSMKHLQKKTDSTNPYSILTEAIESASPLLKLTSTKKGSKVAHVPTPLRERQRHRRAIVWIIDAAAKRGEKTFEEKFAAEIYDVSQGVSAVLQKKLQLHKQALANRANAQVAYN